MSLAITYANRCGVKLPENPPDFPTTFIPCPEKFITLQIGSGMPAKNYDYYNEVLEILVPILNRIGIHIIQLGNNTGKEEKDWERPLPGTLCYLDQTNIRQSAFLIENALCHFGSDSCMMHIAGAKKTPFVLVVGDLVPVSSVLPYYRGAYRVVTSDMAENRRWTYDPNENPKNINLIKPETVAKAVLDILGIEASIDLETLYVGPQYLNKCTDYIPDFILPEDQFRGKIVNCRMDIVWDLKNLQIALNFSKVHIVTNKALDMALVNHYKPNIELFTYLVDDDLDVEFVKGVISLGIQIYVISNKHENLNDFRLKLLEITQVHQKKTNIFLDKSITCDSFFKSGRIYLGRNYFYQSEYHYLNDIKFDGKPQRIGDALEDDKFLDSSDHYYIFNQE